MAKIEGLRIQNFRMLKDITLGKLWNRQDTKPLTPLTAVIGKNGAGKTTLFDAFGFLADCLKHGVEEACDARGRFETIHSQGSTSSIEFEFYYKQHGNSRPITYELAIDIDKKNRPYVKKERLRQRRQGQKHGWPFSFLFLNEGKGVVWKDDGQQIEEDKDEFDFFDLMKKLDVSEQTEKRSETEVVELEDKRKLGIATLGALKQHPRISAFRRFIEEWYLSYFNSSYTPGLILDGPRKHLSDDGCNLVNVTQYMEREHKTRFKRVLNKIADLIIPNMLQRQAVSVM